MRQNRQIKSKLLSMLYQKNKEHLSITRNFTNTGRVIIVMDRLRGFVTIFCL